MPLSESDRKKLPALVLLAGLTTAVAIYNWPSSDTATVGVTSSVPSTEKRLTRLRKLAAAAPGRQEILKKVDDELVKREKGLIQAETAPQAQAQLLQIVRRVAQAQQPPIVFKGTEFIAPRPLGKTYGEVGMTVSMDCAVEQIVNFLADISNQAELISISDMQFSQAIGKQKQVPARLTFTGIVPRKLVPEKKEASF